MAGRANVYTAEKWGLNAAPAGTVATKISKKKKTISARRIGTHGQVTIYKASRGGDVLLQ